MASSEETLEILYRLKRAYPAGSEMKAENWVAYAELPADVEKDVLQDACVLLAGRFKFWPAVAEIRAACDEVAGARAQIPSPGEAYAEAREAAGKIGAGDDPRGEKFSHELVLRTAIMTCGTWRRWCLDEDQAPTRARFFENYKELRERELIQRRLPPERRHLTAFEAKEGLRKIEAAAAKRLGAGGATNQRGEELVHISELSKKFPPAPQPRVDDEPEGRSVDMASPGRGRPSGIIGEGMTEEEFQARKDKLRRQLEGRFDEAEESGDD